MQHCYTILIAFFIAGVPRVVRMDRGSENVTITDMQRAFRSAHNDANAGEGSVILGKLTSNQVFIYIYVTF